MTQLVQFYIDDAQVRAIIREEFDAFEARLLNSLEISLGFRAASK